MKLFSNRKFFLFSCFQVSDCFRKRLIFIEKEIELLLKMTL